MSLDALIDGVRADAVRVGQRIEQLTGQYKATGDSGLLPRIHTLYQIQGNLEFALLELLRSRDGNIRF